MSRPYPIRPRSRAANYISRRIHDLQSVRTQKEIATLAGLRSINMLSMMKEGTAKVPLDRVVALAAALECDPGHLFRLTLEQIYKPDVLEDFFTYAATAASKNERILLSEWRALSADTDPEFTEDHARIMGTMFR